MDLNTILRWLVTISCFSLIIRVIVSRNNWGWLAVSTGILTVMGISLFFIPQQAGIIGGILWLVFVLIPILGLRQVNHLVYQERFPKARQLASLLSWLHPGDGWQEQPRFLRALELTQKGSKETAANLLKRYFRNSNHGFNYTAKALQFRMEADWDNCLNWLHTEVPESVLWKNSTLATIYLRTLGETGDVNGLIWAVQSHQGQLIKLGDSIPINLARLYVFAFSGAVHEVKKIFDSTLNFYPKSLQKFWMATAQMAAGDVETGRYFLSQILEKDLSLENAIIERNAFPVAEASKILTPESHQILKKINKELQQEINYGGAISLTPTKAYTTYTLMLINLLVFFIEIHQGGSQNLEVLYQLGAAVPEKIFSGEAWRVLTANFLHFGYIHLISNLLGLWILGPYVELYLGVIRYLIVYFLSGVGAISSFAIFAIFMGREDDLLVGASAAIMGLMGATFVILWRGWRQERSRIAKERLKLVVLIIALQVMFDFSVANVSFLGHFFGLILGMFTTSILLFLMMIQESHST